MRKINGDFNSKIFIIGVGGTGSHLVSMLSQLIGNDINLKHKHNIVLIDGDIVEEKNCKTQKFLRTDVGRGKAETLAERYNKVFNLDIGFYDSYINNHADLINALNGMSYNDMAIVVSCVDNNKARRIIDEVFNREDNQKTMIYIDTGNSSGSDNLTGQTVVGMKLKKEIVMPSISKYFPLVEEEEDNTLSCGEALLMNTQNIGANITSATTVFNILNSILSFKTIPGDVFTFDATEVSAVNMSLIK